MAEDDDEPRVLHVAQHEQRHEERAGRHGSREQGTVLGGLCKGRSRSPKKEREEERCIFATQAGTLTQRSREGALRPARSMTLKTMKQQTQVNTLSVGGEKKHTKSFNNQKQKHTSRVERSGCVHCPLVAGNSATHAKL